MLFEFSHPGVACTFKCFGRLKSFFTYIHFSLKGAEGRIGLLYNGIQENYEVLVR
jgi:hypothetical protein